VQRGPDEPWEEYKKRRQLAQDTERKHLKGKLVYDGKKQGPLKTEKTKVFNKHLRRAKKIVEAKKKVKDNTLGLW
jgi:predicted kinase